MEGQCQKFGKKCWCRSYNMSHYWQLVFSMLANIRMCFRLSNFIKRFISEILGTKLKKSNYSNGWTRCQLSTGAVSKNSLMMFF